MWDKTCKNNTYIYLEYIGIVKKNFSIHYTDDSNVRLDIYITIGSSQYTDSKINWFSDKREIEQLF